MIDSCILAGQQRFHSVLNCIVLFLQLYGDIAIIQQRTGLYCILVYVPLTDRRLYIILVEWESQDGFQPISLLQIFSAKIISFM